MSDLKSALRKAAPRFLRAVLGSWLVMGPFVVFLIRWRPIEVVLVFILVVGAYVFVGWNCLAWGRTYLTQLAADTAIAVGFILLAGVLSGIIAKLTGVYLHGHVLFVPLVVFAGFFVLEYLRERKHVTRQVPEAAGDLKTPSKQIGGAGDLK
jgi:hypothetical protein